MKKVNYLHAGKIHSEVLEGNLVVGQACRQQKAVPVYQMQLLPSVLKPGKIICAGMNYPPPAPEPDWRPPEFPVLFHKPSSALVGYGTAIRLPAISQQVLYEGELAVVIGTEARYVPIERALEVVAGYTIANDVGAADIEGRSSQWASGKMFDTFCPLGPALVTADEIADPDNLCIKTTLNDQVVQESSTAEMIFSVPYLVSHVSQLTTLQPDDLILAGSPKRAGDQADPRIPLKAGDTISIEIEGLGVLSNPVVAEESQYV